MGRIEEFEHGGRNFVYLDLSGLKTNDEINRVIEDSKTIISRYENHSLYTITNIEDVKFDTKTKEIVAEWMEHNNRYVKHGAVIGMTGIKKIMVNAIFAMSGRKNMGAAYTKEKALAWLLQQD